MRMPSVILIMLLLAQLLSGCVWGTAAIVGVAVVGANVNEFQESRSNSTSPDLLDEHLAHRDKVDAALSEDSKEASDPIDTDEVIDTYGSRIVTD